jgi:hypothetical protein
VVGRPRRSHGRIDGITICGTDPLWPSGGGRGWPELPGRYNKRGDGHDRLRGPPPDPCGAGDHDTTTGVRHMAKSPKKPTTSKKAKPGKPSRKVEKAVEVEKLGAEEQKTYADNATDIDIALHRCLSHLGEFEPSEAQVVIKLLRPYYLKYGILKYHI